MQKDKQPNFEKVNVKCTTCSTDFVFHSVLKEIKVDVCSSCHPFYTGKQVGGTRAGRIERFNKKLSKK